MVTMHTLTGDLSTILGLDSPRRITRAVIDTNLDGEALVDLDNGVVMLDGAERIDLDADNAFSLSLVATNSTGTNVPDGSLRYVVRITYKDEDAQRNTWSSGYFQLTADTDLATVAGSDVALPVDPALAAASVDAPTAANVSDTDSQTSAALAASYAGIDMNPRALSAARDGIVLDTFATATQWDRLAGGTGTTTVSGGVLSLAATSAGTIYRRGRYLHTDLTNKVISFEVRKDANLSALRVYLTTGDDYTITRHFKWDMGVTGLRTAEWETVVLSLAYATKGGGADATDIAKVKQIAFEVAPTGGTTSTLEIRNLRAHDKTGHTPAIIWQFDDGHLDTYTVAKPILDAAGFVGSVGPMPDKFGPADPAYMTVAQLQDCHADGWETFGHYFTNFTDVTATQAEANMRAIKVFLQNNGLHRGADFLAWPSSARTAALEDVALRLFNHLRRFDGTTLQWCAEPYVASRRDVYETAVTSTQLVTTVKNRIDAVAAYGGVLVLVFHKIVASGATGPDYNVADFQELVTYAVSKNVRSTTMTDEWGGMAGDEPYLQRTGIA